MEIGTLVELASSLIGKIVRRRETANGPLFVVERPDGTTVVVPFLDLRVA